MLLFSFGINVCGREDGVGVERQMGVAYSHKPGRGKKREGLLAEVLPFHFISFPLPCLTWLSCDIERM